MSRLIPAFFLITAIAGSAHATDPANLMARADAARERKDYAEVFQLSLLAAGLGDARAQNNVCAFYIDGQGIVVPNEKEAMKWCKKAADNGSIQALKNIGDLYIAATVPDECKDRLTGAVSSGCFWVGGPNDQKNELEALTWYRKAAEKGHPGAMAQIGWMFALGHGVRENCPVAKQWFERATSLGNEAAVTNLRKGIGRCRW